MCGLAGILTYDNNVDVKGVLNSYSSSQAHRGPDIHDSYILDVHPWKLGLAHQRLSILDLSDAGKQPMHGRKSSIVYNGEVYNYREIKDRLPVDIQFNSSTDTEVILHALEYFGIEEALNYFNGMWAIAWYDKESRKLYLTRDRFGIKPLYIYQCKDNSLYFSSEVKAILKATDEKFSLNYQAIGEYLTQSLQDTENNSFYNEITSVPPGCYAEIDLSSVGALSIKIRRYWNLIIGRFDQGSFEDPEKKFFEIFSDAIRLRLRSDVPVGVTLSGGLDSSSIATMMKKQLRGINSFKILSAVSPGSKFDESEFIDEMSAYLNVDVDKVELDWSPEKAINLLYETIKINDSPIGSFSNVAHYLLMQKAKEEGITVILSGQGADEVLCGYKKYTAFYLQDLLRNKKYLSFLKEFLMFILNGTIFYQFKLNEAKRYIPFVNKLKKYEILGKKVKENFKFKQLSFKHGQTVESRQLEDITAFSVPYLTHYEDRMSMAFSREIRLPFLDYRLVEFCLNLPTRNKVSSGWTKKILRDSLKAHLPEKITWRKDKQGFVNPQELWLKNELRESVLYHFKEDALIFKFGIVCRGQLLSMYDDYCMNINTTVWYRDVFAPLALEVWLQINKDYLVEN